MTATMTGYARALLAALLLCLAIASPALAQTSAPVLREQIRVHSDFVTLGDIFEHAGPASGTAVFRSPDLGTKGVVGADRVRAAAQQHGLYWDNPGGITQVSVERPGRLVSLDEITRAIAGAAADEMNGAAREDLQVVLERRARAFHVDPRIEGALTVKRFHVRQGGAFEAEVGFETVDYGPAQRSFKGRIQETMPVPVPVRPIDRGETMARADVEMVRLPRAQLRAGIVLDDADLAGMAAKRPLDPGEPVRANDIEHPKMVTRNSLVTVVYRTGGLVLKAQGLAQSDAHDGATISVLNPRSKRIVQGVVRGPGLVVVESLDAQAAAPQPRRAQNSAGTGPRAIR